MRKSLMIVVVLLGSAGAVRAEGLRAELELSSASVAAGENLVAAVTILNESTRTVLVPRWLVPGARLDADLFEVTRGGEAVTYLGRLVKRFAPGAGDFVAIAPGAALTGATELTQHYDMGEGGEYVVVFRIDLLEDIAAEELAAEKVESNAVAVWREGSTSGSGAPWAVPMVGQGSLQTTNCSAGQADLIASAVDHAGNYSSGGESYLDSRSWNTVGPRYTTWFGTPDSARFDTVSDHFQELRQAFNTAPIVVDCACNEPYYAYVYPSEPYFIYVCNAFWSAPTTGTDSKAGTLVHEMSHFYVVASTTDVVYGQTACRNLALSNPQQAIRNADSHEYFAENTPPLEGGGGGGGAGSFRFQNGSVAVDESAGQATLTVRRINGSNGAVSVSYSSANGTASAPADYSAVNGILAWANGDSSDKSILVPLIDDTATEADETFSVSLSSPTGGASLGSPSSSTVTILDTDCTPSLCVADDNTLCLAGGSGTPNRFRVRVTWTDFQGNTGPGQALSYTADSGFFYFFDPLILELLVKIVNGCGANGAYWFFYGSTSNVELEYVVEDLQACEIRTVSVPLGVFASNGDIQFFAQSCP